MRVTPARVMHWIIIISWKKLCLPIPWYKWCRNNNKNKYSQIAKYVFVCPLKELIVESPYNWLLKLQIFSYNNGISVALKSYFVDRTDTSDLKPSISNMSGNLTAYILQRTLKTNTEICSQNRFLEVLTNHLRCTLYSVHVN